MRLRTWLFLGALASACVGSAPAFAQTQSGVADALFKKGVELAKDGKFGEAAEKLLASYQLDPARGTLQALAMAEERAGKLATAHAHFSELLDLSLKANDSPREKIARERMDKLAPRLPKLELRGTLPGGAEVMLDSVRVPLAALGTALPVDPGEHRVKATGPGGASFDKTITVAEAQALQLDIVLAQPQPGTSHPEPAVSAPAPEPADKPSAKSSTLSTVGWITTGVGVVGLGLGSYFWIKSNATYNDVQGACPDNRCATDMSGKIDDGKTQETIARVGMIAGGVALVGGVTMILVGRRPAPASTTSARLTAGPTWVGLSGSW
jgi:hypothetical protein